VPSRDIRRANRNSCCVAFSMTAKTPHNRKPKNYTPQEPANP